MKVALSYFYDPAQAGPAEGEVSDWLALDAEIKESTRSPAPTCTGNLCGTVTITPSTFFARLTPRMKSCTSDGVTWIGTTTQLRPRSSSASVTSAGDFTCAIGSPMMGTTRVSPLSAA